MPKLRQTLSTWSARNCAPLIELLDIWKPPLLSEWVFENILDQLVMPKLQSEVEAWDPTTDTVPIHRWIHPWLPLMRKLYRTVLLHAILSIFHFAEQRLETLYGPIRYKMATALNNWHPSDSSAHKILEPWLKVSVTVCLLTT